MLRKNKLSEIGVVNWGVIPEFDIVINATSVGLNNNQKLDLDFSNIGKDKFFYDVIYNPKETKFLKTGKDLGNQTENGKKCSFIKLQKPLNFGIRYNQKLMKK